MIEQLLVVTTRLLVEDVDLPILSLICVSDVCKQCNEWNRFVSSL